MLTDPETQAREMRRGALATVGAFLWWGIVPIYWKAVGDVPPREMIAHRILWSVPFGALLITLTGAWPTVGRAIRSPRVLRGLALSALVIGLNWFVFIEAIAAGKVLQSSLGYYINPLVNVLLGFCFLGERLRIVQWIAVALAAAGVLHLVVAAGEPPWIALVLAFSFGLYGLIRKTAPMEPLPAIFLEVLLLAPFALALLGWWLGSGHTSLPHVDALVLWLVPLTGLVTFLPLWAFSYGARRLRLATVGIVQFIAPTGQFLLAVWLYGEPFHQHHAVAFALIWSGLVVYVLDLQRSARA